MFTNEHIEFLKDAEKKAFDVERRNTFRQISMNYLNSLPKNENKKKVANFRTKVLNELEKNIKEFEFKFEKNGGKIHWAVDEQECINLIFKLIKKEDSDKILKIKAQILEEISLKEHFKKNKKKLDLGSIEDYILHDVEKNPNHVNAYLAGYKKEFIKRNVGGKGDTVREIVSGINAKIKKNLFDNEIVISGSDFLLADIGAAFFLNNEGEQAISFSNIKKHIIIADICSILPNVNDLGLFWDIKRAYTKQTQNVAFTSMITGKNQETHVILLDNMRSKLLEDKNLREAAHCINCGACSFVCPVFRSVGGETYQSIYSGPIGCVKQLFLGDVEANAHLAYACTNCGKCSTICPVHIPVNELIIKSRHFLVKNDYVKTNEKLKSYLLYKTLPRQLRNIPKQQIFSLMYKSDWGKRREFPLLSKQSFKEQWIKEHGK